MTVFNNSIVDDKLPVGLRKELNKLSKHPVLEVPMRTKGITAGKMGCCYWNADVVAQTFGGKPVYGFLISKAGEELGGYYKVMGHGCWMNPEGNLVDVTNSSSISDISESIGFLPLTGVKLKLWGALSEQIKTFYFGETKQEVGAYLAGALANTRCFSEDEYLAYDNGFIFPNRFDISRYCEKLVLVNGAKTSWLMWLADVIADEGGMNEYDARDLAFRSFGARVAPVTYSTNPIEICDETLTFQKIWSACYKSGKSAFSLFPNHSIFEFQYEEDLFSGTYGTGKNFVNPSLMGKFKDKFIQDIPPRQDFLDKFVLPKSKTHLKKLMRVADEYELTPQEYLLMSCHNFSLHPHLVNRVMKTGREFQEWKDTKVKFASSV
jgi:hypothetical protein